MAGDTYGKGQQELSRKVEELSRAVDAVRDCKCSQLFTSNRTEGCVDDHAKGAWLDGGDAAHVAHRAGGNLMKIVIYDNGKTINYSSAHNVVVEYGVGIDDLIAAIETGREIVPGVTADYEYTLADARRDARQRRKEMKDGMQKHRDR